MEILMMELILNLFQKINGLKVSITLKDNKLSYTLTGGVSDASSKTVISGRDRC